VCSPQLRPFAAGSRSITPPTRSCGSATTGKSIAKPSVTYPESVEEALCFGWIDGITYRIDDELYTTRFTPRRRRSNWSAPNVQRVQALLAEGRMRPAGVAAFDARTPDPA